MGFCLNHERCVSKCPISGLIGKIWMRRKLNGETLAVHFVCFFSFWGLELGLIIYGEVG